jgi:uncharacterized protein YxjI
MADDPSKIEKQWQQKAGATAGFAGQGTIFTEPILVINQKAKFIDITSEYKVFDQRGVQIAMVRQEGGKKWLRFFVNKALLPANVAVIDVSGQAVLRIDKKFSWWRPKVFLQDGGGNVVGQFVWAKMIGKQTIEFNAGGQVVGRIKAQNWRAWNFSIEDAAGAEVGTISKTWAGLGKEMFTNADHYVMNLHRQLDGPLLGFAVGSALCIDTVLKQSNKS